jgi:hypothetical protein
MRCPDLAPGRRAGEYKDVYAPSLARRAAIESHTPPRVINPSIAPRMPRLVTHNVSAISQAL